MNFRPLYLYIALRLLLYAVGAMVICLIGCNSIVSFTAREYLYGDTSTVPHNKVGLILGTSRYLSPNQVNLYFVYRIEAAVADRGWHPRRPHLSGLCRFQDFRLCGTLQTHF